MGKRRKRANNPVVKTLELIGKPILFLFTFTIIVILSYLHLLKKFTHQFFYVIKRLKSIKITLPHLKLHLPSLPHLPTLKISPFAKVLSVTLFLLAVSIFSVYYFFLKDLPSPELLKTRLPSLSTKIYDRNGTLLYQIYRDENRTLVKLSDLPPYLVQATIASEDKNFYHHHGVSIKGIVRALYANWRKCKHQDDDCSLQGGSTITQQLVKNALLSPEQTLTRKLKEAYLSYLTENLYTKDEILEMYFNYVPYGGTAYGIEEASHQYFNKPARELNLSEAALLAGLPVAPTTLSPYGTHPYLAKNRQSQVLDAMVEMGYLKDSDALAAKNADIYLKPQNGNILAPHFVMYIKDLLVKQYGEDVVSRGGLEVTTTLDLPKQQILEGSINQELSRLKNLHVGNAAGMITSPPTGEILAMVGSQNFFNSSSSGQVNVTLMPRQPGSSIKPITYSLALMNGFTPNSKLEDTPVCFVIPGQANYCPDNYDGHFHGSVTVRTALASSYNVPAIKLLNSLGISKMVELARQMGISTWEDSSRFGLSLTLGGGEVTMYDMTEVYSIFANNGVKIPHKAILSVKDSHGKDITNLSEKSSDSLSAQAKDDNPNSVQVIPSSVAYQISSILSDPIARSPAFGTHSVLNIPSYPVAVKTGTTNNLRDNWTIGYTPDILVATWVGNNDNTPMSSVASGITGASPIWSNTMKQLLAGTEPHPFTPPEQMTAVQVCPTTGAYYCANLCPVKPRTDYFVPGTEPKKDCSNSGVIPSTAASTQAQ